MRYLILGLLDGIVTSVSLASGLLLRGVAIDLRDAVSIALVVATVNSLTSFLAEYSHQKASLRGLEYKLSLKSTGRIMRTLVHRRALKASARSALYNFSASLAGASAVLLPSSISTRFGFYALAAATVAAAAALARSPAEFGEWLLMIGISAGIGFVVGVLFPVAA
ncbi:MAG: hypothetical protein JZD41_05520 [Thermoproteus sp.]|nr:hypothetical protein [Thermoproteus sp.]